MEEKTISGYSLRIREIREKLNLKIADFARKLEVPRSTLVGWEEGKAVSIDVLKPLEKLFNVNVNWLLTGEGEMYLSPMTVKNDEGYKIPLLHQNVSCGPGMDWEAEQNIQKYIDVLSLAPRLKPGRVFALSVRGNSMFGAGIRHGDYVLFNAEENQPINDGIYVFALDGEMFCKHLEFDRISRKVKIYSIPVADLEKAELILTLNTKDEDYNRRFQIFGRVFSWVHPNFDDVQGDFVAILSGEGK